MGRRHGRQGRRQDLRLPRRESIGVKSARSRTEADEWLHRYPDDATVMAYIGRHGWNTLRTTGAIDEDELLEAIENSYDIVVSGLPRRSPGHG